MHGRGGGVHIAGNITAKDSDGAEVFAQRTRAGVTRVVLPREPSESGAPKYMAAYHITGTAPSDEVIRLGILFVAVQVSNFDRSS